MTACHSDPCAFWGAGNQLDPCFVEAHIPLQEEIRAYLSAKSGCVTREPPPRRQREERVEVAFQILNPPLGGTRAFAQLAWLEQKFHRVRKRGGLHVPVVSASKRRHEKRHRLTLGIDLERPPSPSENAIS